MTEKFDTRMYALFAVLKSGKRQWFAGWDEAGKPSWLPSDRSENGFIDAKHFITTKDGWAECDKIHAVIGNVQMKLATVPCTISLTVESVNCTNGY